jgi:hypothetical protein
MRRHPRAAGPAWILAWSVVCVAVACFDPPLLPPAAPDGGTSGQAGRAELAGQGAAEADAGESSMAGGAASSSNAGAGGGGDGGDGGAGRATAGAVSGGSAGSSGGTPARVTWLTLDGNRAPSSSTVNAELGIEGSFYAYADDCTLPSLSWDASTRCVSGMLCDAGPQFEYWGVAVGFDFHNTGSSGDPPDTKLLWDPRDMAAKGVAWEVSGLAPGLQVWVLNMDPKFGGQCSAETCEIPGPPDGTASAAAQGELLFSNMQKDYWGSGVSYDYDPALVHALQFKLPAINVGAVPFSFCIDGLGVIR